MSSCLLRVRRGNRFMLTVHLRINDAATGKPTPVRLRITGPDGTNYAPLGRFAEFASGRNEDVGGQLRLGRERLLHRRVVRDQAAGRGTAAGAGDEGAGVRAARRDRTLGPGQMALRFAVKRWSDLRADGWYPGDTRCHFLTPHRPPWKPPPKTSTSSTCSRATSRTRPSTGTDYPSARTSPRSAGSERRWKREPRLVAVNTLNVHPVLGKVGLLHSHRPVFPLTFGGGDETDDWSVCDWCDQCHRKDGLTVWATRSAPAAVRRWWRWCSGRSTRSSSTAARGSSRCCRVVSAAERRVPRPAGRRQRQGLERRRTRLAADIRPAEPGESLSYSGWIEAVRTGRSFITNGPLLRFDVDGTGPGNRSTCRNGKTIRLRASAGSPPHRAARNPRIRAGLASAPGQHDGRGGRPKWRRPWT